MNELNELTIENGIDETINDIVSFEDLPESMQIEFANGKGGDN